MGTKGLFSTVLFLGVIAGCTNSDGLRGCLGGGETCDPGSVVTQNNDTTVQDPSSSSSATVVTENASTGFNCTATAYPSIVYPFQTFQVTVNTAGGASGAKTVTNFSGAASPSFADFTTIAGYYDSTKAGQVVTRTVQVRDANNNYANCAFSVSVLTPGASYYSPLNCVITIDDNAVRVGDTAHFSLTAFNATNAVFTSFMPTSAQTAADSNILQVSASYSKAAVTYVSEGVKTASVRVTDGTRNAFCSLTFAVGSTGLALTQVPAGPTRTDGLFEVNAQAMGITSAVGITYAFSSTDSRAQVTQTGANTARVKTSGTTDHSIEVKVVATGNKGSWTNTIPLTFQAAPTATTPLTGCSVSVATANAWTEFNTAVPLNSTARVRVFPQGGVGPFSISIVSVTSGGTAAGYTLQSGATDPWTQNLLFSATGTKLVTAQLTDAKTGQSAQCSTYAVVQ